MESDNKKRPVSEEFNDITASLDYSRKRLYRLTGKVNEVMESIAKLEKDLMTAHENAEQELEEQKSQLEKDQGKFDEIMTKIDETVLASSQYVTLNVGGDKFCIRPEVAAKYPLSYFGGLFSGRHELKKEADGSIFIDRSGTLFRHIADFLRSDKLMAELSEVEKELLLDEARYYCLDALIDILNPFVAPSTSSVINLDQTYIWEKRAGITLYDDQKTVQGSSSNFYVAQFQNIFGDQTGIHSWKIKVVNLKAQTDIVVGIKSNTVMLSTAASHEVRLLKYDSCSYGTLQEKFNFKRNTVFEFIIDTDKRLFTIAVDKNDKHITFGLSPTVTAWQFVVKLRNDAAVIFFE